MNSEILSLFSELADIFDILGDVYRMKAFRTAITRIAQLNWSIKDNPSRIITEKIPGVADGLKKRLLEYARTGEIAELNKLRKDKRMRAWNIFTKIIGVGPAVIHDWLELKIYTLSSLRKRIARGDIVLNKMQQYGLRFYDDLCTRIPREEVWEISEKLRGLIQFQQFNLAGSYRRGALTSGDIDIVCVCSAEDMKRFHENLINDPGYIDTLSIGASRETFLYKLKHYVRQIDILYVPREEYWPSMLYFTGDWGFNEVMRGHARRKGYRLSQHGLYQFIGKKLKLIPTVTEQDIFKKLELPYMEPSERSAEGLLRIIKK